MNNNNNAPNNKGNPQGNNFFNKNPIFIFAIFAIVMIIVFKGFFDGNGSLGGALNGTEVSKNVPYSELKKLIESGQINQVSIGQTTIKAVSSAQNTVYTTKKLMILNL